MHERTYQMAMTDSLTQVGSRYRYEIEGRWMIEKAAEAHSLFTVIMIDIDCFKVINDTCGHKKGDEVLQSLARYLSHSLPTSSLLARLGGDEFVILCSRKKESEIPTLLEKMKAGWSAVPHPGVQHEITLSCGVFSRIPEQGTTLEAMVNKADMALYDSKRNGRNRVTFFSP